MSCERTQQLPSRKLCYSVFGSGIDPMCVSSSVLAARHGKQASSVAAAIRATTCMRDQAAAGCQRDVSTMRACTSSEACQPGRGTLSEYRMHLLFHYSSCRSCWKRRRCRRRQSSTPWPRSWAATRAGPRCPATRSGGAPWAAMARACAPRPPSRACWTRRPAWRPTRPGRSSSARRAPAARGLAASLEHSLWQRL